ncbi:hypothetical protein ACFQZZ_01215 [Nocardia sp. GCM10030253]|uniref:hypothetical protein n=1 Tax=Nocardia sp. GCM10030253 TaxID=3273404 RepID=UPI003630FB1C
MNVHTTEWTMISDISPESAYRTTGSGEAVWLLSWLPDRLLTREQALAGMELDEILSDPHGVHDRDVQSEATKRADAVGIDWEQAVILLSKRILARLRQHSGEDDAAAGEPVTTRRTFRSRRISMHPSGPPRVFG